MSDDPTQADETWEQAIPATRDALDFLHTTANDVATSRTIESDVRKKAVTVSIRLAASLAAFGFGDAAEHAREVIDTLQRPGLPQPERLQQQVSTLLSSLATAIEE